MKKLTLFALVFLFFAMSFAGFSGCSKEEDKPVKASDESETSDDIENTTEYKLEVFDWNQRKVNVMVNEDNWSVWGDMDFVFDEEVQGEPVNDAVWMRNIKIEEMFNIQLNIVPGARGDHVNLVRRAVLSGDNRYDIAFSTPRENYTLFLEGFLENLFAVTSIDLNADFWDQNAVKDLSIGNKLYMIAGDIGLMPKRSLSALMFNKKMIENYGYESPYNHLANNTWTIDTFTKMCRDHASNITTTTEMSIIERKYSLITFSDMMPLSLLGAGIQFAGKNRDDLPEITFYNDRTVSAFGKITEVLYDRSICWDWSAEVLGIDMLAENKFMADESLFYWAELRNIEAIRGMDSDFGILPVPKYDSNQPDYCHTVNPWVAMMMAIPIRTDDDILEIGAIANACAKLGKDLLTPAYYDITLQRKLSRDDESEITIDIILQTMRYDQGYMYNWGNVGSFTSGMCATADINLASAYEKIERGAERDLGRMLETLEALD